MKKKQLDEKLAEDKRIAEALREKKRLEIEKERLHNQEMLRLKNQKLAEEKMMAHVL